MIEKTTRKNSICVFIDASNLWAVQKTKGRLFDYGKLTGFIKGRFDADSIQVFYYTAYPADGTRDYSLDGRHRFFTFLKKGLNFVVRKKELKRISIVDEYSESIQEKGNMDVEMTIDVLHHLSQYTVAIFFTGDSDFLALVSYVRNRGKKVFIFSSKNNISQELRTGGDGYFDVLDMGEEIWGRELRYRGEKQ
ncbi:MAG: NYN domain-containing protein [bacterium]